ncbi:6692_t:CDS:2 [Paraglomus occultum]|uniref:6692_t:CDS:1 n=1 Tax=Paraglomus occultum TaxID=144539 RepID=A0A9N9FZH2_9GLOM|nr:6692_t:CDS:2 [Paraglomus occultum]
MLISSNARAHLNRKNPCRSQRYRRDPMPAPEPSPETEIRADNENSLIPESIPDQAAKGVQKVVVKKNLTHDMYDSCLQLQKEHMVTMHRLGSKDHVIRLLRSSKIGLSPLDTKRWILSDGITTLAFGDWRIRAYKNLIKSGMTHEDAEKRITHKVWTL